MADYYNPAVANPRPPAGALQLGFTEARNADREPAPVTSIGAASAGIASASVAQAEVGNDLAGSY